MIARAALVSLLLAASFFVPRVAAARPVKPSAQQIAEAKAAFASATAAYDAGHFQDALRGFEHAHELSRNPVLFFNMAACSEKLGELRVAAAYLRTYLSEVPQAEDSDKVRERIGGLEARAQQADDQRAEETRRAEDEARHKKEERERPSTVVLAPTEPTATPTPVPTVVAEPSAGHRYAGGFAALGATAGLGIIAAGLGGSAIVKYNDLNSSCGAVGCGSRVDPVRRQAIAADAFIGLTGAAAVTTLVLFIIESRHQHGAGR